MTSSVSIIFPFGPVAKGRPRFGNGFTYTPKKTRIFENQIKLYCLSQRLKIMQGPLRAIITFYMPSPKRRKKPYPTHRPDWDNLAKAICDALNGIIWKDDSQLVDVHVKKIYSMVNNEFSPSIHLIVDSL